MIIVQYNAKNVWYKIKILNFIQHKIYVAIQIIVSKLKIIKYTLAFAKTHKKLAKNNIYNEKYSLTIMETYK